MHGRAVEVRIAEHDDLDRAVTTGGTDGFAKLVADGSGRLLGATIVGPHAGTAIAEMVALVRRGGTLRDLAQTTHAYPTYAEAPYRAGVEHVRDTFLVPKVRALTRPALWLARQVDRLRA